MPKISQSPGERDEPVPELDPQELEKLTDLVYQLLRQEVLLQRERRGTSWLRDRR